MKKALVLGSLLTLNYLTAATVNTDKPKYTTTDTITINFKEMDNHHKDWIGIYPKESSNTWKNLLKWGWTENKSEGILRFKNLPAGEYEARAFYNNSYNVEARKDFVVKGVANGDEDNAPQTTLYEDAEGGFDQAWFGISRIINAGAAGSKHSVRVARTGGGFSFNNPPRKMKYLILDLRVGTASHAGNFGLKVNTNKGKRRILFESYKNHLPKAHHIPGPPTLYKNYLHVHPAPTDYFFETVRSHKFIHYKINIAEKLKVLEPDIELISITLFTSAGGDFDNIKLSSH